ncbi:hypothetical protein Mevan_0090 [Methanococcus vannielii SB]|uniref:Transglutaminase-like domain-containing protein n=1 Tax=Methanococcus vannielii (strain ATCC 35089 / DSM 1224 / JCM 13029 / OCM 148 / SB) TaxID=406327 RepID=A6UND2_METVS|nr:transglutaminase-like domain-containing protein [Methanococcus vannielii]ABR54004.1 hypothetical protein Mevan_0090 [Methanococcus vannielii SB]
MKLDEYICSKINYAEIAKIKCFIGDLYSNSHIKTFWNVLEWLEHNISYDIEKSNSIVVKNSQNLQTPFETIILKKGICLDYSILIMAILLNFGYDNFYLCTIKSRFKKTEHSVIVLKYDNNFLVLDNKLPLISFEDYISGLTINGNIIEDIGYYLIQNFNQDYSIKKIGCTKELTSIRSSDSKIPINIIERHLHIYLRKKGWEPACTENLKNIDERNFLIYYDVSIHNNIISYICDSISHNKHPGKYILKLVKIGNFLKVYFIFN